MSPEAEKKLMEYLLNQERADVSGALRRLFDAYQEHEAKDEVRHAEIRGEMRGHSLRVGKLEDEYKELKRSTEDTGRFKVDIFREEAKESRKDRDKMKWAMISAAGSFVMLVLATVFAFITRSH